MVKNAVASHSCPWIGAPKLQNLCFLSMFLQSQNPSFDGLEPSKATQEEFFVNWPI